MTKHSKSYCKFIAVVVAVAVLVAASVAFAAELSDIDGHRHEEAIKALVADGIINGFEDGEFKPNQDIKRGDAAVMIARALGILDGKNIPETVLTDLGTVNATTQEAIAKLVRKGIISGFEDGTFKPNNSITRGEMAKLIALAYDLELGDGKIQFSDVRSTQALAKYVDAIAAAGITQGYENGDFGYADNIRRGDFAKFVYVAESLSTDVIISVVESVRAITETVDAAKEEEQLEFTINNGKKVTVQDLLNNGYDVTFRIVEETVNGSTKDVVSARNPVNADDNQSQNGKIVFNNAKAEDQFKYQVEVSKDGKSVYSNVQEVEIVDSFNKANSINVTELTVDGVKNESGVLSLTSDNAIAFTKIQYTNSRKVKRTFDTAQEFVENRVKFTSSNPQVAVINKEGEITLINNGSTTIAVEVAGLKKEISITVKDEKRRPVRVTSEYSAVKLAPGTTRDVEFVVRDQFGDVLDGVTLEANKLTVDDKVIASLGFGNSPTNIEGKVTGVLAGTTVGEGNLHVYAKYDGKTTSSLVQLPVQVTGTTTIDTYKLEKVDEDGSFELDAYIGAYDNPDDRKVILRVNGYNSVGTLVSDVNLGLVDDANDTTPEVDAVQENGKLIVDTALDAETNGLIKGNSNIMITTQELDTDGNPANIITVKVLANGDLEITPVSENVEGTATVYVKEHGLTIASQQITVVNTTPAITGITFNSVPAVTELENIALEDVIDLTKITVSNIHGIVALNKESAGLYLDTNNNRKFDDNETVIGDITVFQSGEFKNKLIINNGEIGTFAEKDNGTVIVKVTGTTGEEKVFTTAFTVNIPK